jgi:hypothetical protein
MNDSERRVEKERATRRAVERRASLLRNKEEFWEWLAGRQGWGLHDRDYARDSQFALSPRVLLQVAHLLVDELP